MNGTHSIVENLASSILRCFPSTLLDYQRRISPQENWQCWSTPTNAPSQASRLPNARTAACAWSGIVSSARLRNAMKSYTISVRELQSHCGDQDQDQVGHERNGGSPAPARSRRWRRTASVFSCAAGRDAPPSGQIAGLERQSVGGLGSRFTTRSRLFVLDPPGQQVLAIWTFEAAALVPGVVRLDADKPHRPFAFGTLRAIHARLRPFGNMSQGHRESSASLMAAKRSQILRQLRRPVCAGADSIGVFPSPAGFFRD